MKLHMVLKGVAFAAALGSGLVVTAGAALADDSVPCVDGDRSPRTRPSRPS